MGAMDRLVVATLNIWNRSGPWDARLGALRAQLSELNPDVIGMQEVIRSSELDQAASIGEGLGYQIAWGRAHGTGGNAILSKWPIRRSACMELPHCGSGEFRSVLYAQIEAPYGIQPFYCTHLNWKLDHGPVRQRQVRALTDFVERLSPGRDRVPGGWTGYDGSALGAFDAAAAEADRRRGVPVESLALPIVVGDFNAEAKSEEIRFMSGWTGLGADAVYYRDCFAAAAGDGEQGATYCQRNPYTNSSGELDRRIDYIFLRGVADAKGRGKILGSRVCFDREQDGAYPSDHFGVVAEISL